MLFGLLVSSCSQRRLLKCNSISGVYPFKSSREPITMSVFSLLNDLLDVTLVCGDVKIQLDL